MENSFNLRRFFTFSKENLVLVLTILLGSAYALGALFSVSSELFYLLLLVFLFVLILQGHFEGFLAIVFLTMIFERFFTLTPFTFFDEVYKIYPLDFLIIFSVISFFFSQVLVKKQKIRLGKLGIPILVFGFFVAVSTVYSIQQGGDKALIFSSLKNYFIYSILYFLAVNIIRTEAKLNRFVKFLMVCGLFVTTFVFIGIVRGEGLWTDWTPLSTEGSRLIAPSHAFYLGITILMLVPLYTAGKNIFGKLTLPIIILELGAVLLSLSRHLWLALAFSLFVIFVFIPTLEKKKLFKSIAIFIFIAFVLFFIFWWLQTLLFQDSFLSGPIGYASAFVERLTSINIYQNDDSSGLWRIFLWTKAFNVYLENPVIGAGYGKIVTFDYRGYPIQVELRGLHNSFLGILVQMGALGMAAFMIILIKPVIAFFKKYKEVSKQGFAVFIGAFAAYLYFLVCANFGVYLELNLLAIFFWLVLGIFEVSYIILAKKNE